MGKALCGIVAVFAQLPVDGSRENTRAGLVSARAKGRIGVRPTVMTPERIEAAVLMWRQNKSIATIAAVLGAGASSVSRALTKVEQDQPAHG